MDPNTPSEFMRIIRTRAFNIVGFGELLTLDGLDLPPGRRREYVRIVREEIAALDQDVRDYFAADSAVSADRRSARI